MDLTQLITAHRRGRTYLELEAATGGRVTRQRWQQLATAQPRAFPNPDTIIALAAGLGVPERTVLLAVGESLGLRTGDKRRLCDRIPEKADQLPTAAIAAILASVNAMISLAEGLI